SDAAESDAAESDAAGSDAAGSDAERLFREGRSLLVGGRFGEACAKLEQSQQLEPRVGTQLNIGFCRERLGQLARAWSAFQDAAERARREGDAARERFARSRGDALAPRVPRLRLQVASAPQQAQTLTLDGAPLPPSSWGDEQPLDPGEHVLSAARGGEEYWRTTVMLHEAERARIAIPEPPPPIGNPEPRPARRFVYELGAFVGYIDVASSRETPDDNPGQLQVEVQSETGSQLLSCASDPCRYLLPGSSAGFVVGVSGFLGYAVAAEVELGLRFLAGPRAGGGALAVLGPSASFRLGERYRLSPAVLFGTASHAGDGFAQLRTPNSLEYIDARLRASLGFSIGLGSELSWVLSSQGSGAVLLQAVPLFLYGPNGFAWSLPVGATYRWN
ncbi:MAG TPA: hypothetical protein VFS67_12290, partial [Polyangiaceae bacterium]|nr:hypothetical protein [Polyangiaceae bacterium]